MKKLIRKEREIYKLYESGLTVDEIARELFVSVGTVQFWLESAKEKKDPSMPDPE